MKLYRLTKPSIDGLVELSEVDPRPGVGEVLVRLRSASLNYKDLLFVRAPEEGGLPVPHGRAIIPLSDAAGEVVEIGSRTSRFAVGDQVAATVTQNWINGPL